MRALDIARSIFAGGALGLVGILAGCGSSPPSVPLPEEGPRPSPFMSSSSGGLTTCTSGASSGVCDSVHYCQDPNGTCAANDAIAYCVAMPGGCSPTSVVSVCGCDGMVYGSACNAAEVGVDVNLDASKCAAAFDASMFACGNLVCDATTEYCRRSPPEIAGGPALSACVALPEGCIGVEGTPGECACLASEPCGASCTGTFGMLVVCT